jgi:hypothetical protein
MKRNVWRRLAAGCAVAGLVLGMSRVFGVYTPVWNCGKAASNNQSVTCDDSACQGCSVASANRIIYCITGPRTLACAFIIPPAPLPVTIYEQDGECSDVSCVCTLGNPRIWTGDLNRYTVTSLCPTGG